MATLTFHEKTNESGQPITYGRTLKIDGEKLIGNETKSLYIRKGFKNGSLFLSQRNNGAGGSGDVCKIGEDFETEISSGLFSRILILAEKSNAIIL